MSLTNLFKRLNFIPEKKSFALDELDIKLEPYLFNKDGFFVECGANDGLKQSNTLYYERYRRWNGLLIEPIPELADQCLLNRPHCIVENCALVAFDFAENEIEMRYSGLMSLVTGSMKSIDEENNHIQKGIEFQKSVQDTYVVRVAARTLTTILDQHGIQHIDFLSLDVEGYELNALKGIDFERHRPTYMLIEARYRDEIDAFLSPHYEPIAELSHHDVLYKASANPNN